MNLRLVINISHCAVLDTNKFILIYTYLHEVYCYLTVAAKFLLLVVLKLSHATIWFGGGGGYE